MENIIFAVLVLGAIAIVFGLILSVAAKVFEVKVDERLPKIQECLAGANCGGCGYPGCGGCAEAILAGKAPVTACAPAGPENAAKIAAIMGMEAPSGDKMVAHVLCNGGCNAKDNFEYRGVHDCLAATKVCGGDAKACRYGCFGFAAIGLYLLYINFATGGHWFLTFAFPVTGAIGLLVSGTVALLHYLRRGQLFVIGGALILGGGVTVLIEYLLNLTFHVGRVFFWSVYPLSAGVVLGVTLLVVGFCNPLRRSLHRKFFL